MTNQLPDSELVQSARVNELRQKYIDGFMAGFVVACCFVVAVVVMIVMV